MSRQAWATKFETLYKGHAIIIDSQISATPDSDGPGPKRYELEYRVFPPGEVCLVPRTVSPPCPDRPDGFEAVTEAGHHVGDHVVFGARLASFHYDSEADQWVIGLGVQERRVDHVPQSTRNPGLAR